MDRDADGEVVFRQLVTLCIVLSGLGSPRAHAVVKETYPALNSVVKVPDIGRLADLSRADRERHVLELAQIVMGIRLFNKDCRKGGESIEDLPELLTRAAEATKNQLECAVTSVRSRCQSLTSALITAYHPAASPEPRLDPVLPPGCTAHDAENLKSALCLSWLQSFCLRELHSEFVAADVQVGTCVEQLRVTLVQLHETVRYRAAIPTVQVYPLFVQLSLVWRELQYEAAVLSHVNHLLRSVVAVAVKDVKLPFDRGIVDGTRTPTSQRWPLGKLELKGFCPWTLVQTDGGLLAGDYAYDSFAFRSEGAARAWSHDPAQSLSLLHAAVASRPELRRFLQVPAPATPIRDYHARRDEELCVETVEVEIQTEVHPVPYHVDRSHAWSEWELKRRAVQLARLTRCATKSQQTDTSCFRTSKGVQSRP